MRAVDIAARLVARHLTLGQPPRALIATLGGALLREDACFHAYQMLEVGVRQFGVGEKWCALRQLSLHDSKQGGSSYECRS